MLIIAYSSLSADNPARECGPICSTWSRTKREIRGKKTLITGAASGIGRALAVRLAREGADLFLLDIDQAGLSEVVAETSQYGVEVIGRYCDLSQPQQITASINALLERWGTLDILVNNAGVCWYGPTLKMTGEEWDRLLAVNLDAPLQLTRELLPILTSRPDAHILNVASICGLVAGGRYDVASREAAAE